MPRILEMCEDLAERFVFEPSKVAGIAKALREAGLIKAGPRGINAPAATPLDTARILIGMMLRVKLHEVAEGVRLFGGFETIDGGEVRIGPSPACTFEGTLASILEYCMQIYDDSDRSQRQFLDFDFSVSIIRDACVADISAGRLADEGEDGDSDGFTRRSDYRFIHPELRTSMERGELSPEMRAAWQRYRSGFHESPMLLKSDLIAIGQVLAGHQPFGWCPASGTLEG